MAAPTRSPDTPTAADARGGWSVVLGVLSVVVLPAAIVATRWSGSYELLHAGFAVPVAILLGIGAVVLARRAQQRQAISVMQAERGGRARVGRLLGILGICLGCSGAVALAVYALLTWLEA